MMKERKSFRINSVFLFLFSILWGVLLLLYAFEGTLYLKNSLPYIVDLFVFAVISLFVYVTGFWVYRILKLDCPTRTEETVYCCAFGIGILAYLVLGVGLLGFLYKSLFYVIFTILTIFFLPYWYRHYNNNNRSVAIESIHNNTINGRDKYWEVMLCSIIFFLFVLTLINTLAPEISYDAMFYHYGLPNIFIQEHQIRYIPENICSGYPLNIEMLFTLGTVLRGYEVANLIEYGVSILFILSVFAFAKRFFDHSTALVTTALLFSVPLIAITFSRPAADMGLALFICLGLFSFIIWIDKKKDQWLVASALFCGLALGTKYTALFYSLGILGFMLLGVLLFGKTPPKKIVLKIILFFLGPIIIASPWYVKNWIATANPLFPAFNNFFKGEDFSAVMDIRLLEDAGYQNISSIKDFLLIPYRLLSDASVYGESIGPFLIFFWPFLLLVKTRHSIFKYLIIFVIASCLLWVFSFQQTRFMISAVGVSAILGGFVCEELRRAKEKHLRYFSVSFLMVTIAFNISLFLTQSRLVLDPFPVVFGAVSKSDYLKRHLSVFSSNWLFDYKTLYNNQKLPDEFTGNIFSVIEYANRNLKSTDKILFLGETIHAYLKIPYICNTAFNSNLLLTMLGKNVSDEEAVKELNALGITHILFNVYELKRLNHQGYSYQLNRKELKRLKKFLNKTTFIQFRKENVLLLELHTDTS